MKLLAIFLVSHVGREVCVEQLPAVSGIFFSPICISGSHDNNRPFLLNSRDRPQPFWHEQVTGHALQVWSLSFGCLVRFNCARNSFEHWQPSMGLTWKPRAFEPYHESCMRCGCIMSLTSSPCVPFSSFFMCSCVLLPPGRFGPLRAEVVVGWRRVRLVQALLSSPSSAGLVPCPSTLRFVFSLAFSGFARSGLGFMCWCFLLPSSFAFPSLRPG